MQGQAQESNGQPATVRVAGQTRVKLLEHRVLRGCNAYHTATVFSQRVDLGALAGLTTAEDPEFASRFCGRFVGLEKITPRGHMTSEFLSRLYDTAGVLFEEALFEAMLAVELSMAFTLGRLDGLDYAAIAGGGSRRIVDFVWDCRVPGMSRMAARVGLAGFAELLPESLRSACPRSAGEFATRLAELRKRARRRQWAPTAATLMLAARKRGLPCKLLGDAYLLLGEGIAQHVIYPSAEPNGSGASKNAARSRLDVKARLTKHGLPVPVQLAATTGEQAVAAAERLGYPVTIKPLTARDAMAPSVGIRNAADVLGAFGRARRKGAGGVTVERFVGGQAYSLFVYGGRVRCAVQVTQPEVARDGRKRLARRAPDLGRNAVRPQIRGGGEAEAAPERRAYRLSHVPRKGKRIALHAGVRATLRDFTDTVHATHAALAIRAARALELDPATVTVVTTDIARPHDDGGAWIVDVSAQPSLDVYARSRLGQQRDLAGAVLDLLFPAGTAARVPAALIAGERGTSAIARDLDALLRAAGRSVGLADHERTTIAGEPVRSGPSERRDHAQFLLHDPRVETLVATASPRRIVRRGLRLDRCTVAAITEPKADSDSRSLELAHNVIARATSGFVVINAGSALALAVMQAIEPERVVLVSPPRENVLVRQHLASGRIAVLRVGRTGDERIELRRGEETVASIPLFSIGSPARALDERRIRARMFAVALAFGLGLSGAEVAAAAKRRRYLQA